MAIRLDQKTWVLVGLVVLGLAGLTGWSYRSMTVERLEANRAAEALMACRQLGARIDQLRGRMVATDTPRVQLVDLTQRIEQSAKLSRIPADGLVRIWPESARRVDNTPYKKKSTQVLMRQVTLRQFITFLHTLIHEDPALQVTSLRLAAPRGRDTEGRWTAEAALTSFVYAPQSD